jgi:hypothetical protein
MSQKKAKVTKVEKIEAFLKLFKDTSMNYKMVSFIPRSETNKSLLSLEINQTQAKTFLGKLTSKNYIEGPLIEDNSDFVKAELGDLWVFGCKVITKEAYIKLKVATSKGDKTTIVAKVLSFHLSDKALDFKYK